MIISNKQGFITKVKHRMKKGFIYAKAEEPTQTEGQGNENPQVVTINYEDLIARARKEEKDKLYPKLEKLELDNKDLVAKHNQALISIGEKDTEISRLRAELEQARTNSTTSNNQEITNLKAQLKEAQDSIAEYKANEIDVDELTQKITQQVTEEYEVKLYKEQKLREVGNEIIPELVMGTTKEEIDNSIVASQERYKTILQNVAKKSTPSIPSVNVSTGSMQSKEINPTDIANMSPSEWAEYRKTLGLR